MRLEAVPCPCGQCSKWVVKPLFYSQDASLTKEEADEVVRRWNSFEPDPSAKDHQKPKGNKR